MEFQPYEFNNTQNQLIRELSQKMRFVGYFLIALGVLENLIDALGELRKLYRQPPENPA